MLVRGGALSERNRLNVAATLLWSWLLKPRRNWATQDDCLAALRTFRFDVGPRLSWEEAEAALVVAFAQGLVAADGLARHAYYNSLGYDPADDLVVIRACDQNTPAPNEG